MSASSTVTPGEQAASEPGHDGEIERGIRRELLTQLYAATPIPVLAGIPFSLLIAAVMAGSAPGALVLGWLALKLVMAWARSTETARFNRADLAPPGAVARWTTRYQMLMVVDTACWAAMVPLFAPHATELVALALLMCGVLGVAAIGVFTTYTHLPTALLFFATTTSPMALYFLAQGSREAMAVSLGTLIYGGVLGFEAWRSHGRQRELLALRFGQAAVAREREQAMRAAVAATEAKSRFLATVSHEMRTPLNGIVGIAELCRHDLLPLQRPELLERVETALRCARDLDRVIGDLLDSSAIEQGRLQVRREAVDLHALLGELARWHGGQAQAKGLRFELTLAAGLPRWVASDGARLKQVLHNLVGNAVKFTEAGEVRLAASRAAPERLQIEVIDTGAGLGGEDVGRLFQAFERGRAGEHAPGTGLGLSIASAIARALGGQIEAGPAEAGGARFALSLPLTELDPAGDQGSGLEPGDAPMPRLDGRRLLVVDDNEVNALIARELLERLGAEVEVAADGQAALDCLQLGGWHAVLMDGQMPVMDGFEATRRWRGIEQAGAMPRLPIVGLTAHAAESDGRACLDAGMDAHLPKPVAYERLARMLAQLTTPLTPPGAAPGASPPRESGQGHSD